jgi:DNA invertase Pin-like site-specific DNA recombinase
MEMGKNETGSEDEDIGLAPPVSNDDAESADRVIAVYMRLSHKGRGVALQESDLQRWSDLRRWADERGREVRWYKDAWFGLNPDRPSWQKLLNDIEANQIETLGCWRLDRLGKTCSELVELFQFLSDHSVNLVSLKDNFDLSTQSGQRMANVLASVAVYESEVRAERIIAGQESARVRGVRWGGSEKGTRIKVTAEKEAEVKRLSGERINISQIARETGLSRPTIYRVLGKTRTESLENKTDASDDLD